MDVSGFELSSDSTTRLLSAARLSGAEEVVIVFTTDSTNYADAWYGVYADSSWSTAITADVWENNSTDTYTFVIDSDGGTCSGATNGSTSVSYTDSEWTSTDTANTISTYTHAMYTAGEYCTLDAVYVKYSE